MTKKLKQTVVNTQIIAKCKTKYHNVEDILICKNVMSAIEVIAKVFNFIDPTFKKLDIFKRSPEPKEYT